MKKFQLPQVPGPKSASGLPSPSPMAGEETKPAGDFSEVNAFDRMIWQSLYADIDRPSTARAVLDSADSMEIIQKLYPALLVKARQTIIAHEMAKHHQAARTERRRLAVARIAHTTHRVFASLRSMLQGTKQPVQGRLL
jgi:hypothetical protein